MGFLKYFTIFCVFGINVWGSGASLYESVSINLSKHCYQYGFSNAARDYVFNRNLPDDQIPYFIEGHFGKDQVRCHYPEVAPHFSSLRAQSLVRAFQKANAVTPNMSGAIIYNDNFMLSEKGNYDFYDYNGIHGVPNIMARFGIRSSVINIVTNNQWGTVRDAVNLIAKMRRAGHEYVWINLIMKNDCCYEWQMPVQFRDANGNTNDEGVTYSKVEKYAYETFKTLLQESELPIAVVEFGNELDSGFWRGFDAHETLGKMPRNMGRTLRIVEAAQKGIIKAYNEKGLSSRPYFNLHVMPEVGHPRQQIISHIREFFSPKYVGRDLYDTLSFSYYPNARPGMNPVDLAWFMRGMAEEIGKPWALSEYGIASGLAPGGKTPEGYTLRWNYFADPSLCPKLVGATCANLEEMQAKLIWKANDIFHGSANYFAGFWLAPQDNIGNNDQGYHQWALDLYRMSFFRFVDMVPRDGNGTKVDLMQGTWAFHGISERLVQSQLYNVPSYCDQNYCWVWMHGRNFSRSSIVFAMSNDNSVAATYYSDQIEFESHSSLKILLREDHEALFRKHGMKFMVLTLNPYQRSDPTKEFYTRP